MKGHLSNCSKNSLIRENSRIVGWAEEEEVLAKKPVTNVINKRNPIKKGFIKKLYLCRPCLCDLKFKNKETHPLFLHEIRLARLLKRIDCYRSESLGTGLKRKK